MEDNTFTKAVSDIRESAKRRAESDLSGFREVFGRSPEENEIRDWMSPLSGEWADIPKLEDELIQLGFSLDGVTPEDFNLLGDEFEDAYWETIGGND